jgi:hypothetical protein
MQDRPEDSGHSAEPPLGKNAATRIFNDDPDTNQPRHGGKPFGHAALQVRSL